MSIPSASRAICFDQYGAPSEVLALKDMPLSPPSPDEVTVEMLLCPINPSDINYIEGRYGIKPSLPAIAGLEGTGRIIAAGAQTGSLSVGQLVRVPQGVGCWRRALTVKAKSVETFPDGLTPEQAAVFSVNPPTAWCLLHLFRSLQPGQWLIQNAATSAVGKYVIQIARHHGWRTVNLVRDPKAITPLQKLGGDVVIEDKDGIEEQIAALTGKADIRLGLNAVGGDSALRVAAALGNSAAMVTYGAMSKQVLKIPNAFLIFKNLELRGFWMTQWRKQTVKAQIAQVERQLAELFTSGALDTFVEKVFPMEEFKDAVTLAQESGRKGKILIDMTA